jgi:hypothetical protein
MWEHEHSVETSATPDAVWRYWSDMVAWPRWNDGIEKIETHGPFAVGTTFTMTPRGGGPYYAAPGGDHARSIVHRRNERP